MKNRLLFIIVVAIVILFGIRLIILQAAKPAPQAPLQINHTGSQIVAGSLSNDTRVYHIKYENGAYNNTWTSNATGGPAQYATSIGDVDNDGYKEITVVVNAPSKTTGPPSQRHDAYKKIFVYEDGSTGNPTFISQDLGWTLNQARDSIIADANNDGANEFIFTEEYYVKIYRWNGNSFVHVWTSPAHSDGIWSVDVGDADNDGYNEIVVSRWSGSAGSAIVYEYLGNNVWGNSKITESVGSYAVDVARVRDADNDGLNEIIAGGGNNKLIVWEYNVGTGAYDTAFLSDDLGGFTQGVDAGDVNGDGKNEVVVGTAVSARDQSQSRVYVFKYNEATEIYEIIDSALPSTNVERLLVGDLDKDNKDEIVVGLVPGVGVYEYTPDLKNTYTFPQGGFIEID